MTLDEIRQRADLDILASGAEFSFGDADALPMPAAALRAIDANSPGVEAAHTGGLTAVVYKLRVGGAAYAVKQARPACLVQNVDGRASFLNELRRHAELRNLRGQGVPLPGVVEPLYGSLRDAVIVSPWIDGHPLVALERRPLAQLYETACLLHAHGYFEWDYSPGNVLDDGARTWLFDFGYMYRFDPLVQFNSAGEGTDFPQFHPAERVETRLVFARLLELEQRGGESAALAAYRLVKTVALHAYRRLVHRLAAHGATPRILQWLDAICAQWQTALATELAPLYLREAWRSHRFDLDNDLRGRTCTELTLLRADWLIAAVRERHGLLCAVQALNDGDAGRTQADLVQHYRDLRSQVLSLTRPDQAFRS